MSKRIVSGLLLDLEGNPAEGHVRIELKQDSYTSEAQYLAGIQSYDIAPDGTLEVELWANEEGNIFSIYELTFPNDPSPFLFTLPPGDLPLTWAQVRSMGVTPSDPQYETIKTYIDTYLDSLETGIVIENGIPTIDGGLL